MLFKTSLDKTAKGITVFIAFLFILVIAVLYIATAKEGAINPVYITVILLLIYCLAFAFHPSAYKVTSDALFICRPARDIRIKRMSIKSVAVIDKQELRHSIRTFGVGGLFGYYGCFANFTLGSMTWYATRRDKAVLIVTTNNKKIVITPNEPEQFVAAFAA